MMTKVKLAKNTIYQYYGGGWDGCIWEWNFAYIDKKGAFHDLFSNGRNGITTKDGLEHYVSRAETSQWSFEKFYSYNMSKPEAIQELVTENIAQSLLRIAKPLADLGIELKAPCSECKEHTPLSEATGDNPVWQGGLAYAYKDLVCEDCYSCYTCPNCGEFYGIDHDWSGAHGYCEYCEDDLKKED